MTELESGDRTDAALRIWIGARCPTRPPVHIPASEAELALGFIERRVRYDFRREQPADIEEAVHGLALKLLHQEASGSELVFPRAYVRVVSLTYYLDWRRRRARMPTERRPPAPRHDETGGDEVELPEPGESGGAHEARHSLHQALECIPRLLRGFGGENDADFDGATDTPLRRQIDGHLHRVSELARLPMPNPYGYPLGMSSGEWLDECERRSGKTRSQCVTEVFEFRRDLSKWCKIRIRTTISRLNSTSHTAERRQLVREREEFEILLKSLDGVRGNQ